MILASLTRQVLAGRSSLTIQNIVQSHDNNDKIVHTTRTKASLTPPQSPKRPRKLARHKVQASPGSLVISSVAPSPQNPVDTDQAASSDLAKLPTTRTN